MCVAMVYLAHHKRALAIKVLCIVWAFQSEVAAVPGMPLRPRTRGHKLLRGVWCIDPPFVVKHAVLLIL